MSVIDDDDDDDDGDDNDDDIKEILVRVFFSELEKNLFISSAQHLKANECTKVAIRQTSPQLLESKLWYKTVTTLRRV